MRVAPRIQFSVFDGALAQMIQHLIAGDATRTGNCKQLIEIVRIEVAHAPRADLAGGDKLLERRNRLLQRMRPRQCSR